MTIKNTTLNLRTGGIWDNEKEICQTFHLLYWVLKKNGGRMWQRIVMVLPCAAEFWKGTENVEGNIKLNTGKYMELEEMMMRDRQKKNKGYNLRYLIFESIEIFFFKKRNSRLLNASLFPITYEPNQGRGTSDTETTQLSAQRNAVTPTLWECIMKATGSEVG